MLARDSLNGALTLAETAQIACECIRAWGRANDDRGSAGANTQRIAELIMESDGGLRTALSTISAMLAPAVPGNSTAQGEVKPVTTYKKDKDERKSAREGKRGTVRVGLGGGRRVKKKR